MKSSSSTKPLKEYRADIRAGADALKNSYAANSGQIQDYTNQVTGLLPSMIDKYKAGNAGVNAATDYNVDVLGGKYLDQGNPYLDQMIASSNDDIRNQLQASLGARGLTGGSDYADLISKNIAQNTMGMRYQDYGAERDRMANAAGQAPGLAAADVIQVAPMLSTLDASLTPLQAAGGYAQGVQGLLGQYSKTKNKSGIGGLLGGIGGSLLSSFGGFAGGGGGSGMGGSGGTGFG